MSTELVIQVLDEVHEQEIIEEVPEPVFSVSMVLISPSQSASNAAHPDRSSATLHSALRSVSAAYIKTQSARKGVTFPEKERSHAHEAFDEEGKPLGTNCLSTTRL